MEEITEDAREDLWRTLQVVTEWIKVADAKAGAAVAVDGVMLALLAGQLQGSPRPGLLTTVVLSCAIIFAALSALLAIWAVMPRTRRLGAASLVHYGTIARFDSAASYRATTVAALADPTEFTKTITEHIWTISRAADRKYLLVIWSIRFLIGALAGGVLALFV